MMKCLLKFNLYPVTRRQIQSAFSFAIPQFRVRPRLQQRIGNIFVTAGSIHKRRSISIVSQIDICALLNQMLYNPGLMPCNGIEKRRKAMIVFCI